VERRKPTFEDIHAVAVRIAARKMTDSQRRQADRDAKRLSQAVHPRHGAVKTQLYRIAFFNGAAKFVDDDWFGLNLGKETDSRQLGIIHYVFAASATALGGIRNLVRYNNLVNSTTAIVLEETNRQVTLEIKPKRGLESFEGPIAEWGPTAFVALLRDLTGTHIVARSISFIHQRAKGVEAFSKFFGCPVRFGADRQRVTFARKGLLIPIHSADRYLLKVLKAFCEEALDRRNIASTPIRSQVEAVLLELLPNGDAAVPSVAKALTMSARTLTRRLASEGTTYAAVLDDLRRDLAMRYLEDPSLEISKIAWLLGYWEVTSFNHAFQRWTSLNPRAVRARLALEKNGAK